MIELTACNDCKEVLSEKLVPISDDGDYSTLLGMNGVCPESPDGRMIVYARKPSLSGEDCSKTELYVCDSNLENHRKVFEVCCGNHNGPSASFIDNDRIVFRGGSDVKESLFYIYNINTDKLEIGPIKGKESHCAVKNHFPFSITPKQLDKNPQYPQIDEVAVYDLDCNNGAVKKLMSLIKMEKYLKEKGFHTCESTISVSHVQYNENLTAIMMRVGLADGAVLVGYDLINKEYHLIADKPVHQLWFDNESYIAVYQYHDGTRWHMDKSRINRYSMDGEIIELLGGIGNHVDISPDRQWVTGDSMYPDEVIKVFLYKRGHVEPTAVLDEHCFFDCAWNKKVHTNPSFSRDGKRIYFNRPVSEDKSVAVYVDISEYI